MKFKFNWDALGITSSVACAVHCAVLPLVMSSFPIFGVNIIENLAFEYLMIFLAFIIGSIAFYNGFNKHHRNILPFIIFGLGVVFLFAKQAWHQLQYWLLIPAVACILMAHFLNYALCRKDHRYDLKKK